MATVKYKDFLKAFYDAVQYVAENNIMGFSAQIDTPLSNMFAEMGDMDTDDIDYMTGVVCMPAGQLMSGFLSYQYNTDTILTSITLTIPYIDEDEQEQEYSETYDVMPAYLVCDFVDSNDAAYVYKKPLYKLAEPDIIYIPFRLHIQETS